jgi:hypothetical protein
MNYREYFLLLNYYNNGYFRQIDNILSRSYNPFFKENIKIEIVEKDLY